MENITIILPIHKIDQSIGEMVKTSIQALRNSILKSGEMDGVKIPLLVVTPKEIKNDVENFIQDFEEISCEFIINEGETDFCSQINLGVENVKTKYFSILEFDDVYTPNFMFNFKKYAKENPNVSLMLPINELYNEKNEFLGYTNEIVWAKFFNENIESGYIDNEVLKDYVDFNVTGGIFKTDDFISVGKLKPNIKLSFWYEFLLRLTYNSKVIFVIPKIGYCHILNREDSLMSQNTKYITPKEGAFWFSTARQEYLFKEERTVNYIQSSEE